MDRRLSVDASIYTIRWKDLQQIYAVNGFGVIVNAGKATVDGAEIALRYKATRELTLSGSYAHTSGKLTEDAPGLGLSGARLPNAPKDAASAGATYDFQAGAYKYSIGGDVRYVGERNTGFEGSGTIPNYKLPDYTLVDLHAVGDFNTVQVTLFARNLFDKRAQLGAGTNFVPLGGYVQVTPAQPRTIGVSVSGTF
jgi:outer membrane receptor protein involved in Fe transport